MKFIIKTDKGYICEKNAHGYYDKSSNEFYRVETGKWFTSINSACDKVDKLGFTNKKEEATTYTHVGNRITEIIDRIKFGYENITKIIIEVVKE
jgi:phage FluMu protein Com